MPVRFKDTAEYHHRFSPQETQKLQMNSSKVSDLLSFHHQPLVSILKTSSSVLPTEPTDRRGRHSNDDYVLLGNQSKFAPSIRYRLRPTSSVHQTVTPPPPPPPPPRQGHTDASLHKRETNGVRGQSSSQGHSDVEGSVLIGQGVNSRRSQGCQSNADGLGGDRKTKRRLIPGREEMEEEPGLLLRGIARGDEEKVKGHRLGQTYKVIEGSHQKDSPPSSKEKQKQQPHQHHHQHGNDDVRWISSKEGRLRLDQATQTKDTAHHHHELGLEEESNEERQRRRTKRRNQTKGDERQENKENRHSQSPDYQPISRQDNSYHRNRNNNSSLAGNQKIVFSYDDKRRKEKSGGERDPDLEGHRRRETDVVGHGASETDAVGHRGRELDAIGHRGRETESIGHRGRETYAVEHRGRETELQSLGLRAKNEHHDKNRSNHNTEEIMKAKKSGGGIHHTSSSSAHPPPPPSFHHHPQQQHLQPKRLRSTSRDAKLKSVDGSSRHESMLRSSRDGKVGGWRTGHGKTSVEQTKLLSEKRSGKEEKVTSGNRSSSVHGSIAQDKRSSGIEEDKGGVGGRTQDSQMHQPSNVITSQDGYPLFSPKVHPSNRSSKAEQSPRTEDESHHRLLQHQPLSVGYLKEDHPSEYQTQFQWRQTPTSELIVDQQHSASVALHHPHRSASVISLSHPDFRTLFASSASTNNSEDTEYRFQFRPISARNDRSSDRENFAAQKNQMRRGQSLRDLSTGERNEETMVRTSSVGVTMNNDQPRNYRSEYTRNFQPPWNYQYEDGSWKEMEKGRRRKEKSQIGASVDVDSSSSRSLLLLQSSSSDASSWFEEVLELRRHADEYRRRANGTHFSREQLQQLYARNVDSMKRMDGGERRTDGGDRRTDGGERRTDGGERKRTDGGGVGSGGRPLRHHFDRTSHKHSNDVRREGRPVSSTSSCGDDAYDDDGRTNTQLRFQDNGGGRGGGSESDKEQQRPLEVGIINRTKEKERRYDNDRPSSVLSNLHAYHPDFSLSAEKRHQGGRRSSEVIGRRDISRTKRTPAQTYTVSKEDKGVQIDLEGGTAFPSNRRKILSSSSLASQVLQRARNRNNEFWSK